MGTKKCEIVQPIETITTWEVKCPHCKQEVYVEINDEMTTDRGDCEKCGRRFIFNLNDYIKNINK